MKKRLLFIIIFILFIFPCEVFAASAISVTSSPERVYVGDNVTVTVSVSSEKKIYGLNYNVYFDDAKLDLVDFDSTFPQGVAEGNPNGVKTSYYWTFTAKSAGVVSFSTSDVDAFDVDGQSLDIYSASTSIEIFNPSSGNSNNSGNNGGSNGGAKPDYNYEYSSDNSLSYLNVEGFDISFDPSVTEYSVTVPNDTKKVSVGATANDGNASVSGIGDYDVKEGSNKIEILVTAENGDTRTYTIDVVVKEESPIEVKVGDEKFTVVRKADKLPKANATYSSSTILIKGESIPCYHSDITDIYLVGLMNEKGKIKLYRYLSSSDKFVSYTELNVGGLYLVLTDAKDAPNGYTLGKITIDGKEYDAYLKDGAYSLLHGINLESGKEDFYSYDDVDKTVQRFNGLATSSKGINNYVYYGLIGLCIFEFIMLIFSVISKNKKLKNALHDKLNTKTEYEKALDTSFENSVSSEENYQDNEPNDESDPLDDTLDDSYDNVESIDESNNDSEDIESEQSEEDKDIDSSNDDMFDNLDSTDHEKSDEWESSSDNYKEFSDDTLGHTALISRSVSNVYNNSVNRKEDIKKRKASRKKSRLSKKNDEDDMFKF